jgi:hypothetical protein
MLYVFMFTILTLYVELLAVRCVVIIFNLMKKCCLCFFVCHEVNIVHYIYQSNILC